jgi:hypothetical protein
MNFKIYIMNKIKIYRVEHKNGYGLFYANEHGISKQQQRKIDKIYFKLNESLINNNIVSPFSLKEREKLGNFHNSSYFFAFTSLKILQRCLREYITILYDSGFKVYEITIFDQVVIKGDKQAMFMKGDIINKTALPLAELV